MNRISLLGVCAGNGATLKAFENSDIDILGNIEPRAIFHTSKNEQWEANYKTIPLYRTLQEFKYTKPDIIVGHPDCGHSSVLTYSRSKALKNPKENESLNLFFKAIKKYKPKLWLMENLEGLIKAIGYEDFRKTFPEYKFKFITDSVTLWGNSQVSRKRLVIIAKLKYIKKLKTKFSKNNFPKTSDELIGDIVGKQDRKFGQIAEPLNKIVCLWYEGKKVNLAEARDIWNGPLKSSYSWPGHYNAVTQPGVYKLFPNKPPRTVRKQNRQFNQLGLHLTPREMARIQGIPDDFKIYISEDRLQYWINKARATVAKCPPYEIFTWFNQLIQYNYEKLLN